MTASRRLAPLPWARAGEAWDSRAVIFALLALALVGAPLVRQAQTATVLVKNTGQTDAGSHGLGVGANFKRAQAFTTSTNAAGYTLSSIGFSFDEISSISTAGAHLVVTLNDEDSSGNPGTALCTLTDPGPFSGSGVQTFDAPATDPCPTLAAGTTYFAVVERVVTAPSAVISLDITNSDNEDTGGADGWSIGDDSYVFATTAWVKSATVNYRVAVSGSVANNPATGAPSISGTPRVGVKLTADTSGISDDDGLASPGYDYQWVSVDGMTETNIGANKNNYTLRDREADKQIRVDVTFTDDLSVPEGPLSSELTDTVAPSDLLVRNTTETIDSYRDLVSNQPERAQAFTTGSYIAGYQVESIGFHFTNIPNTGTAGSHLEATLRSEDSGNPDETLCTLTDPTAFSTSGLQTFKAPTSGPDLCPTLTASTTYFAVVGLVTIPTDLMGVTTTASPTEHAASAPGWSIGNDRQFYDSVNSVWTTNSSGPHLIEVKGEEHDQITVPVGWALTPSGLSTGDTFRLIFVTKTLVRAPNSSDIEDYNAYVQRQAAHTGSPPAHPSIVPYNTYFRVLASTSAVDARDNTRTRSSYTNAAIYWLGGSKVADSYGDLYDGFWDDEANPRDRAGSTSTEREFYTGSTNAGTEGAFPLGDSTFVTVGKLDSGVDSPLSSNRSVGTNAGQQRPYYALSGVFVVPFTNFPPEFSAANTTRTLPENSGAGVNVVGGVIAATDSDSGDTLTYSLTGTDAGSFEIDSSGQLKTKAGITHTFDFESATISYSVTVNVSDSKDLAGDADTVIDDTIAVTINLTNEDEAGTVTLPSTFTGGAAATASVTDPDGTVSGPSWRWARGNTATGSFNNIGGATSATYTPVGADVGKYLKATVTYTDPEGSGKTASAVSSSTVGASNAEPTFDDGDSTTRTFPENSGMGTNVGGPVAATDGDNDTLTYSLTGNTRFRISSMTGQITTASGQSWDYEGTRNFQVTVNVHDSKDAAGNADTTIDDSIAVTINLTNVNEAPMFTSPPATARFAENGTGTVVDFDASDVDASSTLTFTTDFLGGVDANTFSLDIFTGELTFRSPPNFEMPTDFGDTAMNNTYVVTVKVTDGGFLSDTHEVTVTVTDVNEAPEITTNSGNSVIFQEAENTATSEVIETFEATDVDASSTLTWNLQGADADDFTITTNAQGKGELTFRNVLDFEDPKGALGTNPNVYIFTVRVRDNGSPRKQDDIAVNVHVTNVNEAPEITTSATTASVAENTTAVLTLAASDVDASTTLAWSVESADDGGKFDINATTGALSFKNAPDFETPTDVGDTAGNNAYVVTVKVTDDGSPTNLSDTHTVTVTVTNVNEAPEITTISTTYTDFDVDENTATSAVIKTYEATDVDASSTLTWTLEGNDAGDFTIVSTVNGIADLHFRASPNFEMPVDADTMNDYDIRVKVRDNGIPGNRGSSNQLDDTVSVVVNVQDVNEAPEVIGDAGPSFAEIEYDATSPDLTIGTYTYTDEDRNPNDTITWGIRSSDADAAHFNIGSASGVLSFNMPARL